MTKIQAVAYARISQDKRLGDQEGLAVERQLHEIYEYARKAGIEVTREYVDNSVSATSGKLRPAFEEMLHTRPEYIIVWDYDRLVRVSKDLERILEIDSTVYQVKGSPVDLATTQGKMMARMLVSIATYEGEHKAERQKAKNAQLARDGVYRGTQRPMGNHKDGSLHEHEAEVLRREVRAYNKGKQTLYGIVKALNEEGITTSYGNTWVTASIKRALSRQSLRGWQGHKGELYQLKDWTPVLSEEEFADLQARLGGKAQPQSARWKARPDISLLTSIARCWKCGRGLNTSYAEGGKKKDQEGAVRRQYKCPQGCVYVQAPLLEQLVMIDVMVLVAQASKDDSSQNAQRRQAISKELAELVAEHEAWIAEAVEAGLKPSVIASRDAVVSERLDQLSAERNILATSPYETFFEGLAGQETADIEGFQRSFEQMSVSARRDLVRHYIRSIVIHRGKPGKHGSLEVVAERAEFEYSERVDEVGHMMIDWARTSFI